MIIKLPHDEVRPSRVLVTEFGNGLHAVLQYGELDIRHLDRTGNRRFNYGRSGGTLRNPNSDTGLFSSLAELKHFIQTL